MINNNVWKVWNIWRFVEKLTLNCNAALNVYEEGEEVGIAEFGCIGMIVIEKSNNNNNV